MIADLIAAGLQSGWRDLSNKARPATWGRDLVLWEIWLHCKQQWCRFLVKWHQAETENRKQKNKNYCSYTYTITSCVSPKGRVVRRTFKANKLNLEDCWLKWIGTPWWKWSHKWSWLDTQFCFHSRNASHRRPENNKMLRANQEKLNKPVAHEEGGYLVILM